MKAAPKKKKKVLTIYMILYIYFFFQRSILSGLGHFVQEICIFLSDENAIN